MHCKIGPIQMPIIGQPPEVVRDVIRYLLLGNPSGHIAEEMVASRFYF